MSDRLPIIWRWTGESMVPASPQQAQACDRQYVIGDKYRLADWEDRSIATHNHEFAWLHEAWANLPEDLADQYPTPEHLRKRALIQAGYYDEQIIDAGTSAAALRVASGIRLREPFSLVIVRSVFVVIRTAKSQSRRAMDKKEFQASKTAIMEVVSQMVGITPDELRENAGVAA